MNLTQAKKEVDRALASLFYEHMKDIKSKPGSEQEMYKRSIDETSKLLMHMKGRLDVLFGQDTEKLAQFLHEAGITPRS
ncbi:MAG: hypothetical protein V4692_06910 [Bdellovibrionota bacterium]